MWDQWRALLVGLATVPGPTWISHPWAITTAENKAVQLAAAASAGLRVPRTLWTNDLGEARAFMLESGSAVIKTVATAFWEMEGRPHFVFARAARPDDLPDAQAFAGAPICVQHLIGPKRDLRVTVVGERSFAAERALSDGEPLDWRLAEGVPWHPCEIPALISKGCIAITRGAWIAVCWNRPRSER